MAARADLKDDDMTYAAEDVKRYADAIMTEIEHDMTTGFEWGSRLPRDVKSFVAIGEYCDTNDYLLDVMGEEIVLSYDNDDLINEVCDEVTRRLAGSDNMQSA